MIANYHTHTVRCHHAVGTEREYSEQALRCGMKELGFSDHSPYFFDNGYRSRIRMSPEDLPDYVAVLQGLQTEYRDRLALRIGLETEYYPKLFNRLLDYLRQFPLEYLILGQHGLFNEQEGLWTGTPTTEERLLDQYCGQTMEALETGLFTYFAHPDIMNFVGSERVYSDAMHRLCRKAADCGVPLEINLLGMTDGKQYPCDRFFRIAGEEGCLAVLGSDAHAPQQVHMPSLIAAGEALAARCGIQIVQTAVLRPIH